MDDFINSEMNKNSVHFQLSDNIESQGNKENANKK